MRRTSPAAAARNQGRAADLSTRHFAAYEPFIRADKFSSLGTSHRIHLARTGRTHHLLSNGEYFAFLLFAFNKNVVDIREQFPLPLDFTLAAAHQIGVNHPMTTKQRVALPMSVDFMLTMSDGTFKAYDFKQERFLSDKRTKEKLEVASLATRQYGATYEILTENSLPIAVCRNLDLIISVQGTQFQNADETSAELKEWLLKSADSIEPLWNLCSRFDDEMGLKPGNALRIFFGLAYRRELELRLSERSLTLQPMYRVMKAEATCY